MNTSSLPKYIHQFHYIRKFDNVLHGCFNCCCCKASICCANTQDMFKDITRQIPHKQYFPPCPDKRAVFLSLLMIWECQMDISRTANGWISTIWCSNFSNSSSVSTSLQRPLAIFVRFSNIFIDSTYFGLPIPKLLRYFDLPFSNTSLTKELNWLVSWMAAILFLNQAEKNLDFVRERFHSNKSPMYSKMNAVCKQCSLSKGCNTYNILQLGMFTLIYSCQWGMNTDNIPQMVIS